MTDTQVTIEDIKPADMIVDERVQRTLSEGKVGKLLSALNLSAIGIPVLSERPDGTHVIIDGQHRIIAMIRAGYGDTPIPCQVHHGLSISEEAALFLQHNDRNVVNILERFRIGVTAGIPEYVKIDNIATHRGFVIRTGHRNSLLCVAALLRLYRNGAPKGRDGRPEVIDETLRVLGEAWGAEGSGCREAVAGVGQVVGSFNGELDRERLINRLAVLPGGASGIRQRARTRYDAGIAKSVEQGAKQAVIDVYNGGLRKSNQLPSE